MRADFRQKELWSLEQRPPKEPTWFQKLFSRSPKENAFLRVHNLVASSPDLRSIRSTEIAQIETEVGVDPRTEFPDEMSSILGDAAVREIQTQESPFDPEPLRYLGEILGVESDRVSIAIHEAASDAYRQMALDAIREGFVADEDPPALDRALELGLTKEETLEVFGEVARAEIMDLVHEAVSDYRYSPDEEEEIHALAERLGIALGVEEETKVELDRMRLLWEIEEGEPPTVEPGIHLQKNEICYAIRDVEWLEHRKVSTGIQYAGPTARIRIAKGIYFRAGHLQGRRLSEDVLKSIDSGRVFLTNKRILFMGSRGNKQIRLNRILDFTPYSNGVDIQKDAGKSPFLEFEEDPGLFAVYLDRALRDSRK